MEESILLDVIFRGALYKWREKIEAEDDCDLKKQARELKAKIFAALSDKDKNLINEYDLAMVNFLDYIHDCLDVKLINLCVKMGMQIEKSFCYKKDSLDEM